MIVKEIVMKTTKFLAFGAIGVVAAALVFTAGALQRESPFIALGTSPQSYSCSSLHFGMDDGSNSGYICSYGTTLAKGTENKSLIDGFAHNIEIESFKIASDSTATGQILVSGGKYTVSKKDYYATHTHGVKLGSGSGGSKLVITFSSNVIGCDVYAIGWNDASNTLAVNGCEPVSIPKNADVAGTMAPDSINVEYDKYHFDFDETDTLEIVTAKRLFIGDIAVRVKA